MKPATTAAAVLLLLVAITHALRLLLAVPVMVGGMMIPMWASVIGTLVPAVLAIGLWHERGPRA